MLSAKQADEFSTLRAAHIRAQEEAQGFRLGVVEEAQAAARELTRKHKAALAQAIEQARTAATEQAIELADWSVPEPFVAMAICSTIAEHLTHVRPWICEHPQLTEFSVQAARFEARQRPRGSRRRAGGSPSIAQAGQRSRQRSI